MNKQTTGRRLTNKEIAARLSVTSAAVKKRLESVYAKLDVHTLSLIHISEPTRPTT